MMKSDNRIRNSASLIVFATLVMMLAVGCASQKPAPQDQPGGSGAAAGSKLITEVIATEDAESFLVLVKGNRQLTYTSVKQNLPLGVLFYFPETGIDPGIMASIAANNDVIESVETSLVSEEQDMSRILISLKKDTPYEVTSEGTGIRIAFVKPAGSPSPRAAAEPAAAPTPAAPAAAGTGGRLKGVYAIKSENQTRVSVSADGGLADYKSFVLDSPPRIVFDIAGLKSPFKGQQVLKVNTPWVARVRHQGYPDKVRVVLDTKKRYLKSFTAVPVENGLLILVADEKPAAAAPPQMRATQAPAAAEKPAEKDMPVAAAPMPPEIQPAEAPAAAVSADSEKPAWLNRLDFRSEEAGKSTIIVGTTRPVRYDLNEKSDKLLQLTLYNTQLPEYRRRPLITTRFESAANRITPLQTDAMKDNAIVAIELREAVAYQVEQKDELLLIRLEASTIPPKPLEQADLPSWKKVLAQTEADAAAQPAPVQPPAGAGAQQTQAEPPLPLPPPVSPPAPAPEPKAAQAPLTPPAAAPLPETAMAAAMPRPQYQSMVGSSVLPPPVYTGEKIALDFFETDIKNVFRILREISGKNFAIDKNVTGTVTLTLEKPVPWDQVLDLVLKMNRLGMTYEGDIVRIATLATLTAEEKARQAKIAAEQKSRKAVMDLEPLVTEYISVNYSDARSEILPHIKPVLTEDRGKVSVDQRNNQLIVTDTADKIARIKEIVERIDTVTPQVIIEAKVVEISSDFSREIGIEWGAAWTGGTINGNPIDVDIAMNYPSAGGSTIGFDFTRLGNVQMVLNATLNAVEANREGRIISAPKIVTLDNKKAKIKQGLEVPYLERDSSGNATVRFKNVDLLLEVTPTVTPDDRILMKIFLTKNDALPSQPGEAPALSTNEAQTELLVNDGDTIVIGGIIKRNESDTVTGWPGLKDVPLLGWLFKSNAITDTANELLIFISPRIVMLEQRRLL